MRKQTKLVAVLSTAALLAIGASMTSFAAQGWAEEDGTWVYYDKNGDKVESTWKKSGASWYWLDDNGEMAMDLLVEDDDDYYYVDANGVMVTNQWVAIENEDAGEEDEPDHWWYYFGANGKAYKRSDNATGDVSLKIINGKKYTFDDEGKMQFGWVKDGVRQTDDEAWSECNYYFGDEDDGAMATGWRLISITDSNYESDQPDPLGDTWDEEQDRYFWFKASGKKQTSKTNKTIDGHKYGFDEDGRMIASWYTTATTSKAKATSPVAAGTEKIQGATDYTKEFLYFNSPESGARYTKEWFKVVPGYYLQQGKYDDGDEYWYYADGNGNLYANEIRTIKGKKYAFDEYGRNITGLAFLSFTGDDESVNIEMKFADDAKKPDSSKSLEDNKKAATTGAYDTEDAFDEFVNEYKGEIADGTLRCYYFGDDGAMRTGTQTVNIDGDSFTFKFNKSGALKGAGYVGVDDKKLYMAGKQVKADKDDKYSIYKVSFQDGKAIAVEKIDTPKFLRERVDDESFIRTTNSDGDVTWTRAEDAKLDTATTKYYLVGSNGTIAKGKSSAKDGNDYKFSVNSSYEITKVVLEN